MWEWRIFSREKIRLDVSELIPQIQWSEQEKRTDRYFIIREDIGVKERWELINGNIFPLFEVKWREKIEDKIEYWNKIIRTPFSSSLVGKLGSKEIIQLLRNERKWDKRREELMNIFSTVSLQAVVIHKNRTQHFGHFDHMELLVEQARIVVADKTWWTVSIEAEQLHAIKQVKSKVKSIEGSIMGYPEFVISHCQAEDLKKIKDEKI